MHLRLDGAEIYTVWYWHLPTLSAARNADFTDRSMVLLRSCRCVPAVRDSIAAGTSVSPNCAIAERKRDSGSRMNASIGLVGVCSTFAIHCH
jgi:hypothetical protein